MIINETILIDKFERNEEEAYDYLIDNVVDDKQALEILRLKKMFLGQVKKYDYTTYRQDRNETLLNEMGIDLMKMGISENISYNYKEPCIIFNESDLSIVYIGEKSEAIEVYDDIYSKYKSLKFNNMASDLRVLELDSNDTISEIQDNNEMLIHLM